MKKTDKPLPDYILRRLPRHHWKLLRTVPFPWEGVLYYDPLDIELDRPLTFYRRMFCWQLNEEIIFPLRVYQMNNESSHQKRGSKCKSMYRRYVKFEWAPKYLHGRRRTEHLFCNQLTMLCLTGFAIAEPRRYVVDHIDRDTLNDRPSNLQTISQSENCRRSEVFMQTVRQNLKKAQQKNKEKRLLKKQTETL